MSDIATLFANGWGRLFAADHQEVLSAACDGKPLEVRRVGTVAHGARTLYAVGFTDYTTGSIDLRLDHNGTTSEAAFSLGDIGDIGDIGNRTCAETRP
ncbi:hypothetical protein OHA27_36200 [Streptomyces sp. NBC_01619]|uniref:hypothetical protein n=1 Tax=Streptomyces sp. NBC_01619 TaxID=2975901 RepID=UPI00224E8224|nr:hypothetical protein [Streptomyces sp. NBC_01619]MCX4515646.1 hypothetical protein [Streptomyces sp. NBC_01619]